MGRVEEYRGNAAASVDLAAKLSKGADKDRLLRIAERWLNLADRADTKRESAQLPEHPLLRDRLGPGDPG